MYEKVMFIIIWIKVLFPNLSPTIEKTFILTKNGKLEHDPLLLN